MAPRLAQGVAGYPVDVVDPASPLIAGVDFAPGDGVCPNGEPIPISADPDCVFREAAALREGAHLVATVSGAPDQVMIASWDYGAGRGIYLGYHYVTSDVNSAAAHPSGVRLMINAVNQARICNAEDCATPGDEDENGLADCADPACGDAPACQGTGCAGIRVGITGGGFYHDDLRVFLDAEVNISAERVDDCSANNLQNFEVLIVHGNRGGNCNDAAVINAWTEGGGTLIGVPWVVGNNNSLDSLPVMGPLAARGVEGYPVDVVDPASPLITGVDFEPGDGECPPGEPVPMSADPDCVYREAAVLREGANLVATVPGAPADVMLASWDYGAGRGIYLGYHYVTSDVQSAAAHPSGQRLMVNAVNLSRACEPLRLE
ncbi:MAG: hypothetical protein R3D80_22025 [Paracoccaceae bacterium]